MSSKRSAGFTLIEMIIAMVIIGVGLAGVLLAFTTTIRASADPLIQKQMLALAEEMMEEVLLTPYPNAATPTLGVITGCDRSEADDILDYAAYPKQAVCDIDGSALPALAGYEVAVTVAPGAALTDTGGASPPGADVALVTVTVTHGADTFALTGWRTNYAAGLP